MIELSRHIESLLLKNDCVIVPGLGGFITQYVPARYVADERLFLPPCRSVGFNPQLAINDGLLVQSYMQAYDTNYPETVKLIGNAVAQLKKRLHEEGEYELTGIGTLTISIDGKYNFAPCEAGVLSPELYGLDAVCIESIPQTATNGNTVASAQSDKKAKSNKAANAKSSYTISINRELVNYAAAAVVAVCFYLLWATPLGSSPKEEQQQASVVYEQLFAPAKQAEKQAAVPQAVPDSTAIATDQDTEPTAQEETAEPITQSEENALSAEAEKLQTETGRYAIVLVSAISEKNAEAFAQEVNGKGCTDARPYKRGKMVRVVCGNYSSEAEAQEGLTKLRKDEDFAEAWVIELK